MIPLHGIEVMVSEFLPRVVKDGDGNDVELWGIMYTSPQEPSFWCDPFVDKPVSFDKVVMLLGDRVNADRTDGVQEDK